MAAEGKWRGGFSFVELVPEAKPWGIIYLASQHCFALYFRAACG